MQILHTIEQSLTRGQQDGRDMQLHLVHQAGVEILLSNVGSSRQSDVFSARGAPGQIVGVLDPLGDKGEHGSTFQSEGTPGVVGQYEYRMMERRIASPPAFPRVGSVPGTRV